MLPGRRTIFRTFTWTFTTTSTPTPPGIAPLRARVHELVTSGKPAPWDRPAADQTGAQGVGAFLIAGREVALLLVSGLSSRPR